MGAGVGGSKRRKEHACVVVHRCIVHWAKRETAPQVVVSWGCGGQKGEGEEGKERSEGVRGRRKRGSVGEVVKYDSKKGRGE